MKHSIIFIFLIISFSPAFAQESPRSGASTQPKPDSTLTLSIQKFDARLQELQGELEKQVKTKDQAQKVLQQTEDNIKALQSAIQAMLMVKQDTTLHVPTKFKK